MFQNLDNNYISIILMTAIFKTTCILNSSLNYCLRTCREVDFENGLPALGTLPDTAVYQSF